MAPPSHQEKMQWRQCAFTAYNKWKIQQITLGNPEHSFEDFQNKLKRDAKANQTNWPNEIEGLEGIDPKHGRNVLATQWLKDFEAGDIDAGVGSSSSLGRNNNDNGGDDNTPKTGHKHPPVAEKSKPEWRAAKHPKSGKFYYYHTDTRETTWEKPPGYNPKKVPAKTSVAPHSHTSNNMAPPARVLRPTNNNACCGIIKNGDNMKQSAAVSCTAQSTLLSKGNGEMAKEQDSTSMKQRKRTWRAVEHEKGCSSSNAPCAALNDENLVTFEQFQQFQQWQKSTNAGTGCSNNLHLYGSETEAEDDCKEVTRASGEDTRLKSGEDEEDDGLQRKDGGLAHTNEGEDYDQIHNDDIALALRFTSKIINHPGSVPEKMKTTELLNNLLNSKKSINLVDRDVQLIKKLGKGTYGSVWLVQPDSSQPQKECALKVQVPSGSLPMEFIIQSTLEYRIGNQNDGRFPFPLPIELHNFEGGSGSLFFMSAELGVTLHSIHNLWGNGNCVPVEIVVYLADEMLTVLEMLHCKGKYAHCDIKSDNWVIVFLPDGTCIIKLIDFGRAKSLTQLTSRPLEGVAVVKDMMCKNMRLKKTWGVDQDFYGMATCLSILLLKKGMTQNNTPIRKEDDGTSTMELQVNPSFPRSTRNMWKKIFNKLLNFDARKYDETVKEVREELKAYITEYEKNVKAKLEELKVKISSLDTSADRS